ncbi:MAG TPA: polymer-forming cytoskeletal protein [Aromatoleum sp.]|uniref:bactofilin family protein n=1 Tax=Aromatoleum sp. TaxID=2307007 RepID=UPI002B46A927|nr:polymer-forming cytoskeletal protein [Aromatoleum sp.]HJV27259.1 polymer-forming cytoskeletal protein [Aromatoleum sp.]
MFNKPALFPKVAEGQNTRGSGPGVAGTSAGISSTQASSLARGLSDTRPASDTTPNGSASSTEAAATTSAETTDTDRQETGSRLIVGPNVKLRGAEILDCDTLVVEGRVEATMDSRVIRIAENGSFSGTVGIDVAEVHGRFEGELTARSQLVIHSTGRVSGKIRYGKILIEEGGEISGDVQSIASAQGSTGKEPVRSVVREESPIKVAVGS